VTHTELRFQSKGKCKPKVIVYKNLIRHKENRRGREREREREREGGRGRKGEREMQQTLID